MYCCLQSYLSVTIEVEDVNSSPYFEDQETSIYVIEVYIYYIYITISTVYKDAV